jgi:hypothetical protein
MTGFDRRQVLKSVGAGAGTGLTGLGAASAQQPDPETEREDDDLKAKQELEASFTATVGSGFLVINGSSPNDQNASVNISLENVEGDIVLNGNIYQDRTWESGDITFPEVDPSQIIDEDDLPDFVDEINFDDSATVTVVVDTITGVYDPDAEGGPLVTGSIDMTINAGITGNAVVLGGVEIPFEFDFGIDVNEGEDILLTTGESQNLDGEADTLHCADPVVRVVNNEFTVPEAQGKVEECVEDIACINVNEQLDLPSDIPSRNFIELDLDIEWDDNQPFAPEPILESRPKDLDCDGNYDDLDGDGELTIMDVQTLFDHRNDEQLESNAQLYDFADTGDDRISIFDVQALFAMLKDGED